MPYLDKNGRAGGASIVCEVENVRVRDAAINRPEKENEKIGLVFGLSVVSLSSLLFPSLLSPSPHLPL
jgi:hypothetical protein